MKINTFLTISILTLLGLCIHVNSSFAAKVYGDAIKSGKSLEATKEKIEDALMKLDKTIKPLNKLVSQEGDLRKTYKEFSSQLKGLTKIANDIRARATEMYAKGYKYFEKWGEETENIQSEDLRNRSEARRQSLLKQYVNIQDLMGEAKDVFVPLMANLQDIDVYLSSDLNAGSVASIDDIIKQANSNALIVEKKATVILQELLKVTEAINPERQTPKKN